ncbi:MAG TPA: cation:proton antiporter [Candidatus Kapabacteria bacterium]|nr:cation:proton antiporter [Candidatus Kapabacteria bacterium]
MGGIELIQDLGLVMLVAAVAAWLCHRMGVPAVIGYLGAGILVSPHTHAFGLISETSQLQAVAQVGLVFVVFGIGQRISLQRLKRLGSPLILGTILTATLILVGCRWVGASLGWPSEHSLVLAAILMVSSTAVVGKTLQDAKQTNTSFGQTALSVTAIDDLVALVMLTIIASIVGSGAAGAPAVFGTITRLFAIIVAIIVGVLLLLPPVLKRLNGSSGPVGALVITGTLLSLALISAKASFTAAIGAFALGMMVSTTTKSARLGRTLGALIDVFAPAFFVAMGMLLNWRILLEAWPLVLGVLALALVLRIAASTIALLMAGHSVVDASRAAICLTPIGEFSLILALAAVQGGIVPESFYAVAVAVCLFTAVSTPVLIRHSRVLSGWMEARQPQTFAHLVGLYHEWIENLKQRQNASLLWRLTAPRVVQVLILVLFVSGLLTFASPVYGWIQKWIGADAQAAPAFAVLFWSLLLIMVIAPLVTIWRQVEAMAMICAEAVTKSRLAWTPLRPVFEKLLRAAVLIAITIWFATFVPYGALSARGLIVLATAGVIIAVIFWRRLIRLHSRFEIELRTQLSESPFVADKPQLPGWPKRNGHWKMNLAEVVLNEDANATALKIEDLPLRSEFGCTIVRIERQGILLPNPKPDTILFPNDKLLLLGTEANLLSAEAWLNQPRSAIEDSELPGLAELSLGHLMVPRTSRHSGKSLGELGMRSMFGIQVVGIERGHNSLLSPGPKENIEPGDQLLVLGTPAQVSDLAVWLSN